MSSEGIYAVGERTRSVVRIWNSQKKEPVGTGFLVGPRHLMTCAHVIGDALGQRNQLFRNPDAPKSEIDLDFPSLSGGHPLKARVLPDKWRPQGGDIPDDIAVLEIVSGAPPRDSSPVRYCREIFPGDQFSAFGVKKGLPGGTWVEGKYNDEIENGRIQVTAVHEDQAIREGCSGGAAWNLSRGGLAGMVVEMQTGLQGRIIPVKQLLQVWDIEPEPTAASAQKQKVSNAISRRLLSLLYTFDREEQEGDFFIALKSFWADAKRPIVCAIAGREEDRPDFFRERCLRGKLRQALDQVKIGGKLPIPVKLPWPDRPNINVESALQRLQTQVAMELDAGDLTAEEIRRKYNDNANPSVFFSSIARKNFDETHRDLLVKWLAFWNDVGAKALNKPLTIFLLLQLDADPPQNFCLDEFFETTLRQRALDGAHALARLNDFSRNDVDLWLRQRAGDLGMTEEQIDEIVLPAAWEVLPDVGSMRLLALERWVRELRM